MHVAAWRERTWLVEVGLAISDVTWFSGVLVVLALAVPFCNEVFEGLKIQLTVNPK